MTLSRIFEKNGNKEAGRQFENSSRSQPGFFKIGLTRADFKAAGTTAGDRVELMA